MKSFFLPGLKLRTMKLNCLVIEDDAIQCEIISKIAKNHPDLHLVGSFWNPIEAHNCMLTEKIDLVFLDIELPVMNAFDFLDRIKEKPQIIFVSAKEEYAAKAFQYKATDYIKKPVSLERFDLAVKRALSLHTLIEHSHEISEDVHGEYIIIKCNLKKQKLYTATINWIEAYGDYVKIITEKGNSVVLSTLKGFEKLLSKNTFLRVHKSYIINLHKIKKINSKFVEIGFKKIPLARHIKEKIEKTLAENQ